MRFTCFFFYLSFHVSLLFYLSCVLVPPATCASLTIPAYCIAAPRAVPHGKHRRSPSFTTIPALKARQDPSVHSLPTEKDKVNSFVRAPNKIIPRGNGICYYLNSGFPVQQGVTSLPFLLPAGKYALKYIMIHNPAALVVPYFIEILRVDPHPAGFDVATVFKYGDTFMSDGKAALEILLRPYGWGIPGIPLELEVWAQAVS